MLITQNCKRNHGISCQQCTWKNITESLDKWNFESLHGAICNLHPCYNFAPMLHENTLVFSQSEACNFYMHIIV